MPTNDITICGMQMYHEKKGRKGSSFTNLFTKPVVNLERFARENGRKVRKSTNALFLRMWCGAYMHTMILPFRGVSKKVDR